jgi:hypothetical protein
MYRSISQQYITESVKMAVARDVTPASTAHRTSGLLSNSATSFASLVAKISLEAPIIVVTG